MSISQFPRPTKSTVAKGKVELQFYEADLNAMIGLARSVRGGLWIPHFHRSGRKRKQLGADTAHLCNRGITRRLLGQLPLVVRKIDRTYGINTG